MTQPESAAALAELAGHPYVLVRSAGTHTGRLSGPLPAAEVLDLGFGAADALVEVHARGLAVAGLGAGSLVTSSAGEPRLALDSVRTADSADRAVDVASLRRALAGLLAHDDDPTTRATRGVLDDATVRTAAALRDSLAAVRLGKLPPRPPTTSTADPAGPSGAGRERVGGAVDPAQRLQARPEADRSAPPTAAAAAGSARRVVLIVVLLVLLGVLVWLLVR